MVGRGADSRSICACILCAFIVGGGSAHASPWARTDGEMLVISRANYFQSDLTPQDPAGGTFRNADTDTYFEYGLTDAIMLGGKVVYGTSWLTRETETIIDSGFAALEGYAQYQFIRNENHAASVKITAGKQAAFQSEARAQLGGDGVDLEIAALYGRDFKFGKTKLFAAAESGYRKRLGASSDIIRSQLTVGFEPSPHWVFLVDGYSIVSLRNEDEFGADYDVLKIQPSILYRINHRWAVQAGVAKDISTRNVSPGKSAFFSLWSAF